MSGRTFQAHATSGQRILGSDSQLSTWFSGVRLFVVCVAISLVSLAVLPSVPSYDPYAWVTWGREMFTNLNTNGGPSWKPFPLFFTTPFALFGSAAPLLWIAFVRVGGLLSFVGAYRMGTRLSGRLAGWFAVPALALTADYATYGLRGTSEPLLVCFALWAIVAHLDGRRRLAFWLLVCLSLIRPEAWFFMVPYAAWMWFSEPASRWELVFGPLLVAAAWTLPPWISVGDPFGASTHAASFNGHLGSSPAWTVLKRGAELTVFPVLVGALVAVAFALRRRDRLPLILAALALAWVAVVLLSTLAAYPGLARFLLPSEAIACVLFGVGINDLASLAPTRAVAVLVVTGLSVACVGLSRTRISAIHKQERTARLASQALADLTLLIARAGGVHDLLPCRTSRIAINHTAATALAWKLNVPMSRVKTYLAHPGVILRGRDIPPLGRSPQLYVSPRTIHTIARVGVMWHAMSITVPGGTPGADCVGS